jgi:predicted aspartyl protease
MKSSLFSNSEDLKPSSFEMVNGIIFVEAFLNGQAGTYIIDTGSPVLLLNNSDLNGKPITVNSATGDQTIREVDINSFNWAGLKKSNIKAWNIDLSHLEVSFQKEIKGVIGFNIIKDHKLIFDIVNSQVEVVKSLDEDLKAAINFKRVIPLQIRNERPYFNVKLGNKNFNFCLDTGAETNILNHEVHTQLNTKLQMEIGQTKLISFNSASSLDLKKYLLKEVGLGNVQLNNSVFSIMDLTEINNNSHKRIDGIVGLLFFQSSKIILDYPNKKLYF